MENIWEQAKQYCRLLISIDSSEHIRRHVRQQLFDDRQALQELSKNFSRLQGCGGLGTPKNAKDKSDDAYWDGFVRRIHEERKAQRTQ